MIIWIALAGSLGAVCRFVLDGFLRARYDHTFPWATALINISGSLVLGLMVGIAMREHSFSNVEAIIGTGFCGGYTTFSTASFEAVRLLERHDWYRTIGVVVGVVVLALVAVACGIELAMWR